MAQGELKNRVRFSTTIDKEVAGKLKSYSAKTMIPVSKLIDIAITNLLKDGIIRKS